MLKELGAPDCWAAAKLVGADVIEVTVDDKFALPLLAHPEPYSIADSQGVKRLEADLKSNNRKISAFCVASRFDTRPDFEADFGAKLASIAQQMGIAAIRIDVVSYKIPPAEFLDTAVSGVKKLMAATEGIKDVRFGVENHGPCGNDPTYMMPLLERVGSKRFGVTLDTGNFYWYGHPLSKCYELYEMVAPHAVHTHCKSIAYPADQREVKRKMGWEYAKYEAPVNQGDIDFARVVKILKKAGYKGDLCVENETLHRMPEAERARVLGAEIAYLKDLRA
jgi:sugar phosphate isomerase/epimerase